MIVDCISDLHGNYPDMPGGDLLIIAGDLTATDHHTQYLTFRDWVFSQDYKKSVVIAGNHDMLLDSQMISLVGNGLNYLYDSGTEFEGLKIWGSPWTTLFKGIHPKCKAFMDSEDKIGKKFALIPKTTDILVTHSPPYGILDKTDKGHVGSIYLKSQVIHITKPRLHVFGHIHECGGQKMEIDKTTFVNASYVNENYRPVNKPVRIYL